MIDIRIMASPKRAENVQKLLSKLGLTSDSVTWDDRPNGGDAMYTAKKTWLHSLPERATHRLVLQDDVDVCGNLKDVVERIIKAQPNKVISLINFLHPLNYPNAYNSPYYTVHTFAGCAIIMPSQIIKPCMKWCDESDNEVLKPHDDLMISEYCQIHGVPMLTVLPCIVQHPDKDSLLSQTYDWKRTSDLYDEKANGDWDNKEIVFTR